MTCTPDLVDDAARARARAFVPPRAEAPTHVVVALSGGVDSAVVAWLMKEAGHEVTGLSLRLAPETPETPQAKAGRCCSVDDLTDARQLCDALDIPFYAVDARSRFEEAVLRPFVGFYAAGLTPIPCLACNHEVKFGDLYRTAKSLGARLATGHYARIVERGGRAAIARPFDRSRDQTYYLYGTEPEVVAALELPLGDLDKPLVRALAERAGIPVATKPDSQEICFVPDGDHARVVEKLGGRPKRGRLLHEDGRTLREHQGVHRFTVGQRRGLGIGVGERIFVLDVDAESGDVTVGGRAGLACTRIEAGPVRCSVPLERWPDEVYVQVRARHKPQRARWHPTPEGDLAFTFAQPVESVAPGQAAVVYDDDVLLGGGLITARVDGAFPRRARVPLPVVTGG